MWQGHDRQAELSRLQWHLGDVCEEGFGGGFRVRFRTLDGLVHEACGEILELEPPRRLVMSWHFDLNGEPDEQGRSSRIEIDLAPIPGGAEITFTHSDLASEVSMISHRRGWTGSLEKLVRHLGGEPAVLCHE